MIYDLQVPPMQPELSGFGAINRYWDKTNDKYAAKILPGEYYVTVHDELIVTVLGSCVSACIRDTVFGIGGMILNLLVVQVYQPALATLLWKK